MPEFKSTTLKKVLETGNVNTPPPDKVRRLNVPINNGTPTLPIPKGRPNICLVELDMLDESAKIVTTEKVYTKENERGSMHL